MLDALTHAAQEVLLAGGYPGLALIILAENLVPPIPSEVVLPLAGLEVARGELGYLLAVLAATIGSTLGALAIYALGRHGGRPLLHAHHRLVRLREADLDRADAWFLRHGDWAVLLGRVVPGVRSVISFPAGVAAMPPARFAALTMAGSAVWNAALIGAGWQLGDHHERVAAVIGSASRIVLVSAVALLAVGAAVLVRRRRRTVPDDA